MHKPTCLFIGRFQPFHNGHLLVIEGMTKLCGKVIIGIGSSDKSHTAENPFSATERREMIQRALQGKDLIPFFDIGFVNLPDLPSDAEWTDKVLELSGSVDMVWTGDARTKKCFEGRVEVKEIKEVPGISATDIREKIKNRGDWEKLVPKEVAGYLKEIEGLKRLRGE